MMQRDTSEPQQNTANVQGREAYLRRLASIKGATLERDEDVAAALDLREAKPSRLSARRLRSAVRTLAKWSLRLLLVGTIIVLVGLFYSRRPLLEPVSAPVTMMPLSASFTAKNAQAAAEAIALAWAEDARLVRLSATWGTGEPFQAGEGDWSLLYYSPAQAATALVSVSQGRAALIDTQGVSQPIVLAPEDNWQIDSPEAIGRLRAAGGDDFLRGQPEATVSLALDLSVDGYWSARLIDQMSRRAFVAYLNSASGEIIGLEQSE